MKIGDQIGASVHSLMEKMDSQRAILTGLGSDVSEVFASLGTFREITDVILRIATQTKLLSFNAQIEAARTRDSGKGLSVVASEVLKLAERTRDEANKIGPYVERLVKQFEEASNRLCRLEENTENIGSFVVDMESLSSSFAELAGHLESNVHELSI